jgi:hypothetical protein
MKRYSVYHIQHSRASDEKNIPCPLCWLVANIYIVLRWVLSVNSSAICRTDWPVQYIKEDSTGKAALQKSSAPIKCSVCFVTERGQFYRCIECSCGYSKERGRDLGNTDEQTTLPKHTSSYRKPLDFCQSCYSFQSGGKIPDAHATHHFLVSEATGVLC